MSSLRSTLAARRGLRAAQAVAVCGSLAACGTEAASNGGADAVDDTDVASDPGVDPQPEIVTCNAEGPCTDPCTAETNRECCVAQCGGVDWAWFSPESGCSCAIEGPFAPPSFRA
ncbi:MAG: hypothetical protein H6674_11195 [Dehalococcoidia bacterium]|nr:hypothetical protein [Dehalococcoidia bacterium]MCB9508169.1 hypothetical protein [Myxococcales bacterium]